MDCDDPQQYPDGVISKWGMGLIRQQRITSLRLFRSLVIISSAPDQKKCPPPPTLESNEERPTKRATEMITLPRTGNLTWCSSRHAGTPEATADKDAFRRWTITRWSAESALVVESTDPSRDVFRRTADDHRTAGNKGPGIPSE